MKRTIVTAVLIVFCFLLQCTVFRSIAFNGIVPNLLLVLTASFGFMCGRKSGLLTGFFSGLLIDIFFGNLIGFYALVYMLAGFFNGIFRKIFFPEDIKLPLFLITVSDLGFGFICYIFMFLLRSRFQFDFYFLHIIFPEVVYTILVSMILYPLVLKINSRLETSERKEAKKFV